MKKKAIIYQGRIQVSLRRLGRGGGGGDGGGGGGEGGRTDPVTNCSLVIVLLHKLRGHAHFLFSANQITRSGLLLWICMLNSKQCQLIWIYTVYKGRVYPGSAGKGLFNKSSGNAMR